MKAFLFISTLIFFSFCDDITKDKKFQEFLEYTKKYGKVYNSPEEFEKRFKIWKNNFLTIKRNTPSESFGDKSSINVKFKLNEFADLSPEEFKEKYLTFDPEMTRDLETINPEDLGLDDVDAPENWDWTEFGIETPVKHQKDCGSCWAFAAAATIESQYIKNYKVNVSFSEQQLIDCDETNNKCKGGNMKKAFIYLQSHGIMLADDYPFINGEGETCNYDETKEYAKVKEWSFIPKDEEDMKKALYKFGPLAGAVNGWLLAFYDGGIYEPWFSILCPSLINHAVVIVGYGVDEETGKKYWKIKNSWGAEWGENGYFRLLRGEGTCGIDQYTLIADIEKIK